MLFTNYLENSHEASRKSYSSHKHVWDMTQPAPRVYWFTCARRNLNTRMRTFRHKWYFQTAKLSGGLTTQPTRSRTKYHATVKFVCLIGPVSPWNIGRVHFSSLCFHGFDMKETPPQIPVSNRKCGTLMRFAAPNVQF